jgi:hypothetical protein
MELTENVCRILKKYKYENAPLEGTMTLLAEEAGYTKYKTSLEDDLAQLLCNYKWNRLTKVALISKINELDCFTSIVTGGGILGGFGGLIRGR